MACMAPSGGRHKAFVDFMTEPAGVMIVGVVLVTVGLSVEETGTMARIRSGIALRLAAVAVFVAVVLWGALRGAPSGSSVGLGWALIAAGGALVAHGARFDLAAYGDPRHGQDLQGWRSSLPRVWSSASRGARSASRSPTDVGGGRHPVGHRARASSSGCARRRVSAERATACRG